MYVYMYEYTCPRAERDLFIDAASTNLIPVASLREILSEPARSTSVSLPWLVVFDTWSYPSTRSMRSW